MASIIVDVSALKKFADDLKNLAEERLDSFFNETAKALAAEFIQRVIGIDEERTPRGETGQLRDGWSIDSITKVENGYEVRIVNPVEYASYVEYGHRGVFVPALGVTLHLDTRFTEGKFMMTKTEKEFLELAPQMIAERFEKFLREVMKD
jgi:hypothetical protein